MPAWELIEEEQLALALNGSMDTALKEGTVQAVSFLFDDVPSNFLIYKLFALIWFYGLIVLSVGAPVLPTGPSESLRRRWNLLSYLEDYSSWRVGFGQCGSCRPYG